MRSGAVVGGVVLGALALGWFLLERPDDPEIDHPLPSATALFVAHPSHAGLSRFLPFAASNATPTPSPRDTTDWVPVEVRVVDAKGRPVAGASIETRVSRMEYLVAGLDEGQYDSIVAAQESNVPPDASPVEQAVVVTGRGAAGGDGVYRTQVEPRVTTDFLVTDALGREGASAAVRLDRAVDDEGRAIPGEPQSVTVVLGAPAVIDGHVYDDRGRPIQGAEVSPADLAPDGGALPGARFCESSRFVTDAEGEFVVRVRGAGAFDLAVERAGFQAAREPAVQAIAGRTTPVSVTLEAAATIAGRVVAPDGSPVLLASVSAIPLDPGGISATADSDPADPGAFRLEVAPGLYRLVASAAGLRTTEVEGVLAGGAPLTIRLHPLAALSVTVSVPPELAASLGSVSASLSPAGGEPLAMDAGEPPDRVLEGPRLDADGLSLGTTAIGPDAVARIDAPDVPAGPLVVTVRAGTIVASREVSTVEGETASVDFRLPEGPVGAIVGVVRLPDGSPAASGSVLLDDPDLARLGAPSVSIGDDGTFRLENLRPGHHSLSASVTAFDTSRAPGDVDIPVAPLYFTATAEVDLTAGATASVEIDLREVPMDRPLEIDLGGVTINPAPPRFHPDLSVTASDAGLVVAASASSGVLAGDRVLDVDGHGPDAAALEGDENTLCAISLARPATGESMTIVVPRTVASPSFSFERGDW